MYSLGHCRRHMLAILPALSATCPKSQYDLLNSYAFLPNFKSFKSMVDELSCVIMEKEAGGSSSTVLHGGPILIYGQIFRSYKA